MKNIGILHIITDITIQSQFTHNQLAEMAIAGGADTIQFRQKNGSTRQHIEMLELVKSVCTINSVPLIVNDHAGVAIAMEVDGVHFGQDDMPISLAKKILPSDMIVGASARTEDKIMDAIASGADYIGFGPVFHTNSKVDAEKAKGLDTLKHICQIASCPVIAIGGITKETTYEVIKRGAHGIAVISAVCASTNPKQATQSLLTEIQRGKQDMVT